MKFARKFILVAVLLAGLLSACSSAAPAENQTASAVSSSTRSTVAEGILLPVQSLDLAFNTSGRVAEVLISEGSSVQAGEVIARLEVPAIEARQAELARAELELQSAQTEQTAASAELLNATQALEALATSGPASEAQLRLNLLALASQLDEAQEDLDNENGRTNPDEDEVARLQTQVDLLSAQIEQNQTTLDQYNADKVNRDQLASAEARLQTAEQRLAAAEKRLIAAQAGLSAAQQALQGAELTAPWSGMLASNSLKAGAWANAGQTVASLADFSAWIIETDNLTEIDVVGIAAGDSVTVTFDALPGFEGAGTVESIATQFVEKRGDITYTVNIRLETSDPALRWGMTSAVRFEE